LATRHLTTANGVPVPDNQNSLTAGPRGPIVFEDFHLFEKLAHFNRERIPERVVHAKGSGAFGELIVTADITRYTKAKLFSQVGKKTPLFLRFSTVGGEAGSADTERDPRGFAVKFYTEQGVWDLVGNNTPVFFIRDPSKFPDFVHTQKRHPQTHTKNATMQWDFWSLHPESLHQVTILFSDRGIPDGYRYMHGFGSHTYSMTNARGERFFVKYHFRTQQGIRNLAPARALALAGSDPDHAQRDLFEAIERKDFPRWSLEIQVLPETEVADFEGNPFDVTKVWPHRRYPRIPVGQIVLDRNPENYYADVEQAAFAPSSVVPGLGFSPDRMLQGRLFSYADAHRYRLGVNYHQIPVNRPLNEAQHYHRDGGVRIDGNGGAGPNYHPNSFDQVAVTNDGELPPYALSGPMLRHDHRADLDYYGQAGDLYRLMSEEQKKLLTDNIVGAMRSVPSFIQDRQVEHFKRADPDYGHRVARGLTAATAGDPRQVSVVK
jgi:catalase